MYTYIIILYNALNAFGVVGVIIVIIYNVTRDTCQ